MIVAPNAAVGAVKGLSQPGATHDLKPPATLRSAFAASQRVAYVMRSSGTDFSCLRATNGAEIVALNAAAGAVKGLTQPGATRDLQPFATLRSESAVSQRVTYVMRPSGAYPLVPQRDKWGGA